MIHILNGDALRDQFPDDIPGTVLVARESLVEGPVQGGTLEELFQTRAEFHATRGTSHARYQKDSANQFYQIQNIQPEEKVCLWFEDDLFCQVNLWFTSALLGSRQNTFLVRPVGSSLEYGFGGLDKYKLRECFDKRIELEPHDIEHFSFLWRHLQKGGGPALLKAAERIDRFPFVKVAVEAHLASIPTGADPGLPHRVIRDIVDELGADSFGTVFREFRKRASVYGFGDLQVKSIFDEVVNQSGKTN